jgi:SAM-dependent methyltransferase
MDIAEALRWFIRGHTLAWRSLCAGTLWRSGLRSTVGAFTRPLTAPSRYPEYALVQDLLRDSVDLEDPGTWLLDTGSPKLFSLLLVSNSKATVVATDIWKKAIDEATALRGGLPSEAAARLKLATLDVRDPVPVQLRPAGGLFSAAFSMSVIEHVEPDPGGDVVALTRIAEVVRPGGHAIITVPADAIARSEYVASKMYGRMPEPGHGVFFQRVYDAHALRDLCTCVDPYFALERCIIVSWPDHPVVRMQPRFPAAFGLAGATFPLLARRFSVDGPSSTIPDIHAPGDAILAFSRRQIADQ